MSTEIEILSLSPERRALLELLLKQSDGIPRRASQTRVPISSSQQRFWIVDQLQPFSNVFNQSAAIRLQGRLKLDALQQALSEIARRHESLRATFKLVDGQPAQEFAEASAIKLPRTSLHDVKEKDREGTVRRLVQQEASRPFDLARGPLFRVRLFSLTKTGHVFLFAVHHIVADGWSMGLLVRELAALYEAFASGQPAPLPEPQIQFGDFAVWERDYLNDELVEQQLSYWKRQLSGQLPQLALPTDRERTASTTDSAATYRFRIPASLRDFSRRQNITPYTLLLAAYATLLYRYTGNADVVIGSPTANRPHPDTEDLVGCFINTLLMRIDLSGNPTFGELLARVRETTLDAFANQDVPFDRVVDQLERRPVGENPYRVWFVLQNEPLESLTLTDLTLANFHPERTTTPNDLTLSITELGDELACTLDYRTDLFDADTIIELSSRFTALLDHVSSAPETRLLDIPLDQDDVLDPPGRVQEIEDKFML